MKRERPKIQIVLSQSRIREFTKSAHIGDRINAKVEERLEKNKYVVSFHGIKLVAYFKGLLAKGEVLPTTIHSMSPNIVLKIATSGESIKEKQRAILALMIRHKGMVSLVPFVHDTVKKVFIALENLKRMNHAVDIEQMSIKMHDMIMSMVVNHETHCISWKKMIQLWLDTTEKMQSTINDIYNSSDNDLAEIDDLKRVMNIHELLISILSVINTENFKNKKKYEYVQIPFLMKEDMYTAEIYFRGEKNIELFMRGKERIYTKATVLSSQKIITVKSVACDEKKIVKTYFLKKINQYFHQHGWHVDDEKIVWTSYDEVSVPDVYPINILTPQNFTMVA